MAEKKASFGECERSIDDALVALSQDVGRGVRDLESHYYASAYRRTQAKKVAECDPIGAREAGMDHNATTPVGRIEIAAATEN
eukprot:SAG11_NODE_2855_length_2904_cov_2.521925_4_plen_83_part_00